MRKQTKRKVWSLINPIEHAIVGAALVDRNSLDKLRLSELAALDAMIRGKGTLHDWRTFQAIRDLLEYADLQQQSISRSEFEKMIKKTKDHIKSHNDKVLVLK